MSYENVRNPQVFCRFQGISKCNIALKWVNNIYIFNGILTVIHLIFMAGRLKNSAGNSFREKICGTFTF